MADFLLEIGCEEIPARMIDDGVRELRERVDALLVRERLAPLGPVTTLATPRRLAVIAAGIPSAQADLTEQVTGPSAQVAFKDGQPTPAAHAFAKKVGVEVSKLEKIATAKGEYLGATVTRKGRAAEEILAECFPRKSRHSIGRRICTGASAERYSCVRCAGWWRCSMNRRSRWNYSAFGRGRFRVDIGCWDRKVRRSRGPASTWRLCEARRFWCRGARAGNPQGFGCCYANDSRRAVA